MRLPRRLARPAIFEADSETVLAARPRDSQDDDFLTDVHKRAAVLNTIPLELSCCLCLVFCALGT